MAFLPLLPSHPGSNALLAPITAVPGWHRGSRQDSLAQVHPGVPQSCSAAPSIGSTPEEWVAAARGCGHIAPAPLAGEVESFSRHLLRGPRRWPVPTRRLSPSPAPSPLPN